MQSLLPMDCKKLAFLKVRVLSFSGLKLANRAEPMSPIIGMLVAVEMIHQSDSFITIQCSVKWKLGVHITSLDCTPFELFQVIDEPNIDGFSSKKAILRVKWDIHGSWGKAREPSPIWARAYARLVQTLVCLGSRYLQQQPKSPRNLSSSKPSERQAAPLCILYLLGHVAACRSHSSK